MNPFPFSFLCDTDNSESPYDNPREDAAYSEDDDDNYSDNQEGASTPSKQKKSKSNALQCPDCDKVFKKEGFLRRHQLQIHNQGQSPENSVGQKDEVDTQSEKTGDRDENAPFECNECGRRFHKLYRLNRHIQCLHTDLKLHSCEWCGLLFVRKDHLQKHQRRKTCGQLLVPPEEVPPDVQPPVSPSTHGKNFYIPCSAY